MNAAWLDGLQRARATVKHPYVAIHVAAKLRDSDGVAPVVLQTEEGYLRAPAMLEAAFELCLRHLHGRVTPLTCQSITAQALLANRAVEALRLPGRYVPTSGGEVIDMQAGAPTCERPAAYADKDGGEAGDALEVAPGRKVVEANTRGVSDAAPGMDMTRVAAEVEEAPGSAGVVDAQGISDAEPGHVVNEMDMTGNAPKVEEPGSAGGVEAGAKGMSNVEPGHAVNEMDTLGDASEMEAAAPGDAPEVEEPGSEVVEADTRDTSNAEPDHEVSEMGMPGDAPEVDEADASENQTSEAASDPTRAEASTWRDRRRIKRAERRRAKKRRG